MTRSVGRVVLRSPGFATVRDLERGIGVIGLSILFSRVVSDLQLHRRLIRAVDSNFRVRKVSEYFVVDVVV